MLMYTRKYCPTKFQFSINEFVVHADLVYIMWVIYPMMNKINFKRICRTSNEELGVHQVGDLCYLTVTCNFNYKEPIHMNTVTCNFN